MLFIKYFSLWNHCLGMLLDTSFRNYLLTFYINHHYQSMLRSTWTSNFQISSKLELCYLNHWACQASAWILRDSSSLFRYHLKLALAEVNTVNWIGQTKQVNEIWVFFNFMWIEALKFMQSIPRSSLVFTVFLNTCFSVSIWLFADSDLSGGNLVMSGCDIYYSSLFLFLCLQYIQLL